MYHSLFGETLPFQKYGGLGYLVRMLGVCLTFNETAPVCINEYAALYCYQQFTRVPFVSHPRQHLVWSAFLILDMLIGIYYYFILILICVFLMANMLSIYSYAYLLYAYIHWWNVKPSSHFLIRSFYYYYWLLTFLYIFWIQDLSQTCDCLILSIYLCGFSFHFFSTIFQKVEFLILIKSNLSIFFYEDCVFNVVSKNLCLTQGHTCSLAVLYL